MKKLISLVLVALLLCTLTVTGLANPSVLGATQPTPVDPQKLPENTKDNVIELITKINSEDEKVTVSDVLTTLAATDPEIVAKANEAGLTENAAIASATSEVNEVKEDGNCEANYGIKEEELDNFVVMLVSPSGQVVFVKLQIGADGKNYIKAPDGFLPPFFTTLIKK